MKGAIAQAFGQLLRRIWAPTSSASSYSPREFKSVLQRFAPQFSGYQQHDSQELVAFLLDGLHEDLNRVLKKPYVEKPDWEGGGEKELVALARNSWEGYMKRNDSVIVDLFQGQYQSTLVCPECNKVRRSVYCIITLLTTIVDLYHIRPLHVPNASFADTEEVEASDILRSLGPRETSHSGTSPHTLAPVPQNSTPCLHSSTLSSTKIRPSRTCER